MRNVNDGLPKFPTDERERAHCLAMAARLLLDQCGTGHATGSRPDLCPSCQVADTPTLVGGTNR